MRAINTFIIILNTSFLFVRCSNCIIWKVNALDNFEIGQKMDICQHTAILAFIAIIILIAFIPFIVALFEIITSQSAEDII